MMPNEPDHATACAQVLIERIEASPAFKAMLTENLRAYLAGEAVHLNVSPG